MFPLPFFRIVIHKREGQVQREEARLIGKPDGKKAVGSEVGGTRLEVSVW